MAPRFSTRAFSLDLAVWYYLWRGERRCYNSANCMWSRGEGITLVHQTQLTWHFHTSTLSLSHYHSANCVQTRVHQPGTKRQLSCADQHWIKCTKGCSWVLLTCACCVQYPTQSRAETYKLRLAICADAPYSQFCCANGAPAVAIMKYASIPSKAKFFVCWQDHQKRTVIVVLQNAVTGWLVGLSMRWSRSWNSISFCFTGVETSWSLDSQIKVHTWARVRMEFH